MYHLTQTKQAISSLELSRRLGITQNAAWKMKHKLKQVMLERNAKKRLKGRIEMDDAYLGGERFRPARAGSEGKTPFVAAVETTADGKPHQIILRRVKASASMRSKNWPALRSRPAPKSSPTAWVVSPPWTGRWLCPYADRYRIRPEGRQDAQRSNGSTRRSATSKRALVGTYRFRYKKSMFARYLAEFEYRSNRRYDLAVNDFRASPMPPSRPRPLHTPPKAG